MSEPITAESKMPERCKRRDGSDRKWFVTRQDAEEFTQDPANHFYHGDTPVYCERCNGWHLEINERPTIHLLMREHVRAVEQLKETNPRLHEAIRLEALKDVEKLRQSMEPQAKPPKKTCPVCGSQVRVLIHEFKNGKIVKTFCHHCRGMVN